MVKGKNCWQVRIVKWLGRRSCKHVEIISLAQKKQPERKQREKKTKVTSKSIIALRLFDINKHFRVWKGWIQY